MQATRPSISSRIFCLRFETDLFFYFVRDQLDLNMKAGRSPQGIHLNVSRT